MCSSLGSNSRASHRVETHFNPQKEVRYPTIDQYIDALCDSERLMSTLRGFTLPRKADGQPYFFSGNYGVVLLCQWVDGREFAIKCFTRRQWGRRAAYSRITKELPSSSYLVPMEYLVDEIMVAPYGEEYFQSYDIVVMDFLEGRTLSTAIADAVSAGDTSTLRQLSINFDTMALWLLEQSFAHGDIKPDNIVVGDDLSLKLIDYDGIYVEEMRGESQREYGTEAFQHPFRCDMPFDKHIDDYSIALLSLSLRAIALDIELYHRFCGDPSQLIITPSEVLCSESLALNYIEQCALISSRLIDAIKGPSPRIDNLYSLIEMGMLEAVESTINGYPIAVKVDGSWRYVNSDGEYITKLRFEVAWQFNPESDFALVKRRGKYGFLGSNGKMAIPAKFNYLSDFSEGVAVASIDGKYGYINSRGGWIVAPKYDYARPKREGKCEVTIDADILTIEI